MSRNVSLWLLITIVIAIGVVFVQVVRPFVVAIFLAIVLAVLFSPVHSWLSARLHGHYRIAAALTTLIVLMMVLLPISGTLLMAGNEVMQLAQQVMTWVDETSPQDVERVVDGVNSPRLRDRATRFYQGLSEEQQGQLRRALSTLADNVTAEVYQRTRSIVSDLLTFATSAAVMLFGLYYFLADRDLFLGEFHRLMPLENNEEGQLTDRFQNVVRGVVLGTIVAGIVQSALSGIAYAILGIPQVWLLIVLTMVFSFIPFVGSAAIWGSVAIYLVSTGRVAAGLGLALFGAAIVATSDNLVRAYVIGSQSKLHPFIALVTVLGAIRLVGLWGIFIGPMVAAFFYAFLNITRSRVEPNHSHTPDYLAIRSSSPANQPSHTDQTGMLPKP